MITTNGSTVHPDGTHAITAQQIQSGHPISVNSRPLTMQMDTDCADRKHYQRRAESERSTTSRK